MVPAATTGKVFLEGMAAAVSAVATTFPAREEITADMVEMEAVVDPTDFRTVAVGGAPALDQSPLCQAAEASQEAAINFPRATGRARTPREPLPPSPRPPPCAELTLPRCSNMNFARRMECNKCGTPRPPELMPAGRGRGGRERQKDPERPRSEAPTKGPPFRREGDWACPM